MVLGRVLDRFLAALDSEGVGIFQAVVYLHVVIGALYLLTAADGGVPDVVQDSLGTMWDQFWLWLCMGPAVCLIGKVLSRFDGPRYAGFLFQLGGDLFGLTAFVVYVQATINATWFGKAVWAVFVCAALAECILLLVIRDVRRIHQVEQRVRR